MLTLQEHVLSSDELILVCLNVVRHRVVPFNGVVIADGLLLDIYLSLHFLGRVSLFIAYHTNMGEDRDRRRPFERGFAYLKAFWRSKSRGKLLFMFILHSFSSIRCKIS